MGRAPTDGDFTAHVINITGFTRSSKARLGEQTPKNLTPLGNKVKSCHSPGYGTTPFDSMTTPDNPPNVIPLEARKVLRELVERDATPAQTDGVTDVALEDIARFSGTEILPSFGSRLREARREMRLKQQEVGDAVGVTRQTVASWELARHAPERLTEAQIKAIADLLGVRYEWLRNDTGPMRGSDPSLASLPADAPAGSESARFRAKLKAILKGLRPIIRQIEDLTEE